jgi:hypothetical protein
VKDHYENEIRRLTKEAENVRWQLSTVQKPNQLEREKEEKFNELKRSIETLLS